MSAERLNQKSRTLIVHKDDTGYGLTLSGDKPTRVQTVKTGGASHRAGVREGDVIIKVNGQHVMNSDHNEVVKLIQTGSYVALTVVHTSRVPSSTDQQMRGGSLGPPSSPQDLDGVELRRGEGYRSPTGITGPQPVSDQVLRMTQAKSVETLELMIEEQTREIEELRSQHARSPSKRTREKLEDAERKLHLLTSKKVNRHSSPPSPPVLPPLPPTPTAAGGGPLLSPTSPSVPGTPVARRLGGVGGGEPSSSIIDCLLSQDCTPVAPPRSESLILSSGALENGPPPPPLPARNTAPTPPPRNHLPSSSVMIATAGLPPPPPKIPRHNSHENISSGVDRRSNSGLKTPSSPGPPPKHAVHTRTRSSPSSLDQTLEIAKSLNFDGRSFGGGGASPRYETPPGTPPPPYNLGGGAEESLGGGARGLDILTMEDDSSEDEGGGILDTGGGGGSHTPQDNQFGVFSRLNDLIKQAAHLAVFLNYVCSNSNPAPLLFYLITDVYKQGGLKDMRKWAYEIHSCFLLPDSPLKMATLDAQTIQSIDSILLEENEREETLQKLFWKARAKARELLKFQLDAFREKLVQGMGGIFGGPSTNQLAEAEQNESRRLAIAEEILLPLLDTMVGNYESADDKGATLCSAFATVLVKSFNIKSSQGLASIEKIPMFVSKEKKKDKIFQRISKKLTVKGHNFYLRHYDQLSYCHYSKEVIWGIGPQGYRCSSCDYDVCKKYINLVEEVCPGPSQDKKKRNRTSINFLGGLHVKGIAEVGRIMSKDQLQVLGVEVGRKTSSVSPSPSLRGPADLTSFRSYTSDIGLSPGEDQTDVDTPASRRRKGESTPSSVKKLNSGTPPGGSGQSSASAALQHAAQIFGTSDMSARDSWMRPEKSASIKRSESAKDGAKRQQPRPYHRKHSDPSLSVGAGSAAAIFSTAADPAAAGRVSKSGSSSSSSLLTLEAHNQSLTTGGASSSKVMQGIDKLQQDATRLHRSDSLDELLGGDVECPDWRKTLPPERLTGIPKREQKRQDVINELFHTERNHVRNLRILDNVFRKPLQESGLMAADMIDRLFPNLDEVLTVHQSYSLAMKHKTQRGFPVGPVGDLLEGMFQGSAGERLKDAGAKFTQEQHFTIDELKKLRQREPKLESFLSEQERRPECRRLQLQSQLPCQHQRLVKYPLLLENLIKHCDPSDHTELGLLRAASLRTREILESIDTCVARAQYRHKLLEIQRNLDTSGLEKMGGEDPVCKEYRHIDLTKKELLYDGNLTLNLSGENRRNKKIELYVLLLDDSIMFLQKQDEKYLLKFHSLSSVTPLTSGRDEATRRIHSPVIKFSSLLVRTVATNKRAFFVINNPSTAESQLNELIAGTKDECDRWLRHINSATEIYKTRRPTHTTPMGGGMERVGGGSSRTALPRTSTTLSLHSVPLAASDNQLSVTNSHEGPSRSQSFNDSALRRDSIQFRPLPTPPPLDTPQIESLDDKFAKLDAKDREITAALEEKHRILTEILNIPPEEYDTIVDITRASSKQGLDTREALMALMTDVDNLGRWVNDTLKICPAPGGETGSSSSSGHNLNIQAVNPTLDRILTITESLRNNTRLILGMMSSDMDMQGLVQVHQSLGAAEPAEVVAAELDSLEYGLSHDEDSITEMIHSTEDIVNNNNNDNDDVVDDSGDGYQLPFGSLDISNSNDTGEELTDNCVYNVSATSTTAAATTEENREWSPRESAYLGKDATPTNEIINNNAVEEEEDSLEICDNNDNEVDDNTAATTADDNVPDTITLVTSLETDSNTEDEEDNSGSVMKSSEC